MDTYTVPLCERYTQFASRPSAPGDPAPLVSHATFHSEAMRQRPAACAELLSPDDPSYLTYTEHAPGGKGATLQVSSSVRCVWRSTTRAAGALRACCMPAAGVTQAPAKRRATSADSPAGTAHLVCRHPVCVGCCAGRCLAWRWWWSSPASPCRGC
jgi:hypothetical protein